MPINFHLAWCFHVPENFLHILVPNNSPQLFYILDMEWLLRAYCLIMVKIMEILRFSQEKSWKVREFINDLQWEPF